MKPTPFQVFCGYYLGLDRDFRYRFFNQDQLARHFGIEPHELRNLMEEYYLTPETTRHVDYNIARAHAGAQGAAETSNRDDVITFARTAFQEFRQALERYDPTRDFENVDYDRLFPGDPPPRDPDAED
jgi:hypothetical protein